jgi:hypothetical protein
MEELTEERRLKDLRYLREELQREERAKSQVRPIPDGTQKDFRDLLDFACTRTEEPASPPEPTGKPSVTEDN